MAGERSDAAQEITSSRRDVPQNNGPEVPQFRNPTLNYPWDPQTPSSMPSQEPWSVLAHWMFWQYYQQYYYNFCSYVYYWQTYSMQTGSLHDQNNIFQSPQASSATPFQGSLVNNHRQTPIQNIENNLQRRQENQRFMAGFTMPWTRQRQQQLPTVCDVTVASIPKRIFAEFIDFVFLFLTKFLVFSIFYDNIERYNQLQYTLITDETASLEDIEELLVQALVYRFMVFAYEVLFLMGGLHGSVGGATPGKYLMGLSVVSTDHISTVGEGPRGTRVRITPGGNLGFRKSFVRALVKNFSMTVLFPVFLTFLFFKHNRTIYDVISGCTVVVSEGNQRRQQQQQRH